MKKYVIPTVEVTGLYSEDTSMINSSFAVNPSEETVVGGDNDKSDHNVGQLTNGYGWNADDWSED